MVSASAGKLVPQRRLRASGRLPRRVWYRGRVRVPEKVLVIREQKHLEITIETAEAVERANQPALLIGFRKPPRPWSVPTNRHF